MLAPLKNSGFPVGKRRFLHDFYTVNYVPDLRIIPNLAQTSSKVSFHSAESCGMIGHLRTKLSEPLLKILYFTVKRGDF